MAQPGAKLPVGQVLRHWAQPPQSTGAAAPVEVQPPSISIQGVGEIESVLPSVQVQLATEIKAVASSAQCSAAEFMSKLKPKIEIKPSPKSKEPSAEIEKSTEMEMSAGMVKSAEIDKHSQTTEVDYSAEKSSGEIDASEINNKSTAVETSTSQMENSAVENSNTGEIIDASKIKHSAETEKHSAETDNFILRLDPTGTVTLMCLASPVYSLLAALPLWLAADEPQALLWTFAHLACFYLFLWIIALSTTTRVSTAFFRITYTLLLACTAVHLIGPVNGMLFLYAGMVYVAGMMGYAVAEHLHRTGLEQTTRAMYSAQFDSKDCKENASLMCVTTVLLTAPILARMAWVFLVPYSETHARMDVLTLVVELTSEIFIVGGFWIVYMLDFLLGGALVSMESFGVTAIICWVACCALALLCSFKIAEAVGMLVFWLGCMGIGGFFGYCLGLRACYCNMLTGRDSTAAAAKEQNGGTQ